MPSTIDQGTGGPDRPEARSAATLLELVLSTRTVEEHLHQVSVAAAGLSRSIAGAGVTLRRDGHDLTVAASNDLVMAVDEVQYGLATGPCLDSILTGRTVAVRDTVHEDRWDDYPAHALGRGVRSSLSVPLHVGGTTVGALNAYAREAAAFDDDDLSTRLHRFGAEAEVAIAIALRDAEQHALVEQLQQAIGSRSVIDQALGILMARRRCSAAEAFAILRSASQSRNRKVAAIAADIVTATTGAAPQPGRFEP
ncbi:GAF and ANTAR domain-containing protein [Cellulomonas aerilata]|uniref:ANTAR domain-containing protein n=1 Tax=Cellulomonas aerilata TaxID=515326 RepID=A0A512D7W3_9CELL|nr:GAF and ANTAR domain-containing protein [Cellulomonas aerilata]GEO32578.1 ANTAR domain-containing protein [Cellulomonas aerilata]